MLGVSMRASFTTVALLVVFAGGVTSAAAGTLKVTSFPTGAQVIVDGVNTGKLTPMNISLADGDHVVTVVIPGSGWNADTRTVTIAAGNNDLSVTLLPMLTVGPAGPKGDKGDKGDTGAPGAEGPAATRADGPCFDDVNRYVDCGNGTVTDTVTGLIWLKQVDCFAQANWASANQAAAGLRHGDCGLFDNSSPGEWRLPTIEEWLATVARAVAMGCVLRQAPALTNDAGTACYGAGAASSFLGTLQLFYWTGTSHDIDPSQARVTELELGLDGSLSKLVITPAVWPVRGGSR